MITTIYIADSNTSTKKTITWFQVHEIPFRVVNISRDTVTKSELKKLLELSDYGLTELVKRNIDTCRIDDLALSQALDYLLHNPTMIRSPIICNEKHIQVGFHDEEIRSFIPRKQRVIQLII